MGYILSYMMSIGPWSWLIIGLILLGLEVLLPGTFLLWFGFAAIGTGLLAFILPVGIQSQIIIFVIACVISVLIGRKLYTAKNIVSDQPLLNERGDQLIGQTFKVSQVIENGKGKVKIGDSHWVVSGPDAGVGASVKVIAVKGNRLMVEVV